MTQDSSFPVGVEFSSILHALSKQIYETPMAFIRENVQNAIDAVRIQAHRDGSNPEDPKYRIDVSVDGNKLVVQDNGVGMTRNDLKNFFWTIGASGKRTEEAAAAGCVGMFGIGGFANFGVCDQLDVISQARSEDTGTHTSLSQTDIQSAGGAIPNVKSSDSNQASPGGTIVVGHLRETPNVESLCKYLSDFVRFVPVAIFFEGKKLSQQAFAEVEDRKNLTEISGNTKEWQEGDLRIAGRLYEDRGHTLVAAINGLAVGSESYALSGVLRFENGALNAFKHGFKLCATQVPTTIGISGRVDCARFTPTAGRDSLDGETTSLLARIVALLERVAIDAVLSSTKRISQHTRVFRYIHTRGLIGKLDHAPVRLADGSETTLGDIKRRATQGNISVYFGTTQKQALNQVMQARGHIVVLLSADRYRRSAEEAYLKQFCQAKPFDGIVDCVEIYDELSRFERLFLGELEMAITKSYELQNFTIVAGRLTEDLPVYVRERPKSSEKIEVYVDVRHGEVAKLESLGFNELLYSLIGTFCREYLGPSLKKYSPRFFGDGALNLELLARRRSELWILLKDDVGTVRKSGQRQVVTRSDVQVVRVNAEQPESIDPPASNPKPRILKIVADGSDAALSGFYIRLPDSAFNAYGDLLPECESRGVVWAGNRIVYVASDAVSASFQYEIRLDEIIASDTGTTQRTEGAESLEKPFQEMFGGIYFPVPKALQTYLVPQGDEEIRLELRCDWIDMRTAKKWSAQD